jgi:hypothetical protein
MGPFGPGVAPAGRSTIESRAGFTTARRTARICSRFATSEAIVASASPAAARARTNPANTSVSSAASSSGPAGTRASHNCQAQPGPLAFTDPARPAGRTVCRTLATRVLASAQGHPKLVELAEGHLSDPARLTARLAEVDHSWAERGIVPESYLDLGVPTRADATDYSAVLGVWTRGATAALSGPARSCWNRAKAST